MPPLTHNTKRQAEVLLKKNRWAPGGILRLANGRFNYSTAAAVEKAAAKPSGCEGGGNTDRAQRLLDGSVNSLL